MATEEENKLAGESAGMTRDEIRSIVVGVVKSALGAELTKSLAPAIKAAMDAELAPIREKLAAPPTEKPKVEADKSKPDGEQAKQPVEDPRYAELQKKLEKLETEAKESKRQAAAERKRGLETKSFGDLRQALNGKLKPEAVDVAAELLRSRAMLTHDDEGNARLKVRVDEEDMELPIEQAIPHYLKSKEAALFLPPPSGGAGLSARPSPSNVLGGTGLPNANSTSPTQAVERAAGQTFADLLG